MGTLLALLVPALGPTGLGAQQQPGPPGRAELTVFAQAHIAMNQARDEFHAEFARTHEEQAQERARAAFEERVERILAEHELTREEYDRITLLISLDAELRATVEEILAELGPAATPGNG